MKPEKAIEIISNYRPGCGEKITYAEGEVYEAYEMAIESLKRVKRKIDNCSLVRTYEHPGYENGLCAGLRTLNGDGEPCETCKSCYFLYDNMEDDE